MIAGLHPNSIKRLEGFERIPLSSWHALGRIARVLPDIKVETTVCLELGIRDNYPTP